MCSVVVVPCSLFVDCCVSFVVSFACCWLFVVCRLSCFFVSKCLIAVCALFVVCCLLTVVCCLLSNAWSVLFVVFADRWVLIVV